MLRNRIVVKKVNFDKLLNIKKPYKYKIIYNTLYDRYISNIILGMAVAHGGGFEWREMDKKIVYIIEKI